MSEPVPPERGETIRRTLIDLLEGGRFSAAELSKAVGQPEKEIHYHLDHIGRSGRLVITPASCCECGFIFKERTRAKKPGKCPRCKSTRINPPVFSAVSG